MNSGGLKVLIYEDDPLDIRLNTEELKKEFQDPVIQSTQKESEFKSLIRDFKPDIILSDFHLPGFNGLNALHYVKEYYPHLPIIIVTGTLDEETAANCIKEGAWDYLIKEHLFRLNPAVRMALEHAGEKKKLWESERRIRENEAFSRKLLDNIQTAILVLDKELKIVHSNQKACELLAKEPGELVSASLDNSISLFLPDSNQPVNTESAFFDSLRNLDKNLSDQDLIYKRDSDSKVFWLSFSATPLFDEEGKLEEIILSFVDNTDKKIMTSDLVKSKKWYELIFNSVADGIFIYNPENYKLLDVNEKVLEMYGYTREEILQKSIGDLSDYENGFTNAEALKYVERVLKGEIVNTEWRARDKSGRTFWINTILKLVKAYNRHVLMGIVSDIDDRKKTESSLLKSQEHFRALTQNSPDVIMRFDQDHRHLFVNQSVADLIGIEPSEFINKSHQEMGVFPEELCLFWERNIQWVFQNKKSKTVEFTVPGKDGTEVEIEWRLFPEFDGVGNIETVLAVARDITDMKKARESLRKSEERLQIALEGTSDGLWDWDMSSDLIYFSPRFFTMLGYNSSDFEHTKVVLPSLLHPSDREWVLDEMVKAAENGKTSVEFEYRLQRKDGGYSWILSRGKITYDDNGKATRMAGTHADISLRKRHENIQNVLVDIANSVNNTRNLNELFLQIQRSLGSVIDTRNCYVALYDKESDTISLPFHQDEKDSFKEFPAGKTMTGYVIKTGKSQLVNMKRMEELEHLGEIDPIGAPSESWLGVPLKIVDTIIGVFVVQSYSEEIKYTEDDVQLLEFVSDQIAMAIERKKDQDKLKDNELRQRRIIESSPDGLVVIDLNGKMVDFNSTFIELLRLVEAECKKSNFFDFISDDEVIKVQNVLNETLKTAYSKNIEFRMRRSNNSEFYVEASFGLIQSTDEKEGSFVIVVKNIEERKIYEQNLRIAKERAEESDRLKTAFLSNMSHEIRTPMNAIIGFSELLSRTGDQPDGRSEYIAQINIAADTLIRLIDDIMDISKIEAGQLKMNPSIFSLHSIFNDLKTTFRRNLERQNKTEVNLIPENMDIASKVQLYTDEFRLRQVFSNLLSNAVKFTHKGEIRFGIKSVDQDNVTLFVKDTGIGISKEKQAVIFERFRQGHESGEYFYGGTGLGLAISQNIVRLMGGDLKVESEEGKGSEFYFSLSYKKADIEIPEENAEVDHSPGNWENVLILIAEDDHSNFIFLRESLKSFNCDIMWAKTGKEAVEMYKDNPDIDVILMDIQMPELNGYDATRQIKEINPDIPIIAQTAYAMAGERDASIKAGCDDYIAKPLVINELVSILNRFLDKEFIHE